MTYKLLSGRQVNLVEEEVDFAIRVGRSPDSTLLSRRLGVAPVHLVAATEVVTRLGLLRRPTQLDGAPAILARATERWHLDGLTLRPTPALLVAHLETQLGKKKDKARNGSRGREPAEREDAFMSMGMMRRKPREGWARARIRHSAAAPHVRARA